MPNTVSTVPPPAPSKVTPSELMPSSSPRSEGAAPLPSDPHADTEPGYVLTMDSGLHGPFRTAAGYAIGRRKTAFYARCVASGLEAWGESPEAALEKLELMRMREENRRQSMDTVRPRKR